MNLMKFLPGLVGLIIGVCLYFFVIKKPAKKVLKNLVAQSELQIKAKIEDNFKNINEPIHYAKAIHNLGQEFMNSGDLDSDELIWELARKNWHPQGESFERKVYAEFEKLLEKEN